jgi:hypothetical protein
MVRRCKRCGNDRALTDFYRYASGSINPWCKPCYRAWYIDRSGGLTDRACTRCGRRATVTARRAAEPHYFCSVACKDRARKDAAIAARVASKTARACLWCGGRIEPRQRTDAAYCSPVCNSKAHQRTRNWHRRMGVRVKPRKEPLPSLIDIARRSCWRCGICGGRVRPSLAHPDPLAPSIDHIVPLAKGGDNTPENLRLAHLLCNTRRRDRASV